MCPVRSVTYVSGRSLLESNSCNETNIWCFRPFPSIPSNNSVFGKILGRNLETKASFFGPFPAERDILANFVVEVAHVFVLPTQPKLPHSLGTRRAVFQVGIAKTTEGMNAAFGLTDFHQDWMQCATQEVRLSERRALP